MITNDNGILILFFMACFRYHLAGTPLLLRTLTRADVVPACEHCGSPRQFELQLMPGLVSFLQHEKSKGMYLILIYIFVVVVDQV